MRYFGSKTSTLPALEAIVTAHAKSGTLADPFGGVGVVGARFRELGFEVSSGDLLTFPVMFQTAALSIRDSPAFQRKLGNLMEKLGDLAGQEDWVYEYYARDRRFFTPANARAIDAARLYLMDHFENGAIDRLLYQYMMASLIESADRVANTAGTYYAHLKSWNRRALRPFSLKLLPLRKGPIGNSTVRDATETVASRAYDVVYLDPPYNGRDYSAYYHFPESMVHKAPPRPKGISGVNTCRRQRSLYASPTSAAAALRDLIHKVDASLILLHYRDNGFISPQQIRTLLSPIGKVNEHTVTVPGYSTKGSRADTQRIYEVLVRG